MKKALFLAIPLSFAVAFSSCKKDKKDDPNGGNNGGGDNGPAVVAQTQQSTMFYFSGNWCGPCGLYGQPAKAAAKSKHGDKLNIISCQLSSGSSPDPLNVADANSLAGVFQATSVPRAIILANFEGAAVSGGSSMSGSMDTEISSDVSNTDIMANGVVENISVSGTTLTFDTRTKFFKQGLGQYKVAAYLIESGIAGRQYSSGSGWADITFNNILRKSVGATVTGDNLIKDAAANTEYSASHSVNLASGWNTSNMKIVVVIWKSVPNGSGGSTVSVANSYAASVN
jgi:hypothetical protein